MLLAMTGEPINPVILQQKSLIDFG